MQVALGKPVAATGRLGLRRLDLFSYGLIAPCAVYVFTLVGVPFLSALSFSLTTANIGDGGGRFVGLGNFAAAAGSSLFRQALGNSFVFTFGSEVMKVGLGFTLAFILLQSLPAKRLFRFLFMLPWTVPVALSTLSWKYLFDPELSAITWTLRHLGLIDVGTRINWLGEPALAMLSVMGVNVWRGVPFTAIIVLAGASSIPPEILEAAWVDGANVAQRWHYVIVPMILPVLAIGLLSDVVFTFTDLSVVYVLTQGGPLGATQILPTLAYQVAIAGGALGYGAAIALFMLPPLVVFVTVMLRFLRNRDVAQGTSGA